MLRIAIYSNELESKQARNGEATNELERYRQLLAPYLPDAEFTMFDVVNDALPDASNDYHGAIIGGSTAMVADDRPWIGALKVHIRELAARDVKIWGTCFGHQLIADCFGGEVGVREPTLGAPLLEVLAPQKWMHPYLPSVRVYAGNLQQVLRLGPDMRRLAMARGNANAMFAIGDRIVGLQFHPELSHNYMESYVDKCLRDGHINIQAHKTAKSELQEETNHDVIAKWMARFFLG